MKNKTIWSYDPTPPLYSYESTGSLTNWVLGWICNRSLRLILSFEDTYLLDLLGQSEVDPIVPPRKYLPNLWVQRQYLWLQIEGNGMTIFI